jgi:hypothetical protein
MIALLVVDAGAPLTLLFGIILTVVLGGAAGYFVGTLVGRTEGASDFAASLRLARERLVGAVGALERTAQGLDAAARADLAGSALVLRRKVEETANAIGTIERHVAKKTEGKA